MNEPSIESDDRVVVVGSGPCAAVAARRLVERGLRVLMLESGNRSPRGVVVRAAGNTVFRWREASELRTDRIAPPVSPHPDDPRVEWYSSLSLGGLSNYWTAAVPRFAPDDFTDGGRLDERYSWPIGYDDLVPFYEIAERQLVVTAGDPIAGVPANRTRYRHRSPDDWQQVIDRVSASGIGLGPIPMAKGTPWMFSLRGSEFSSYHCVVKSLLEHPRFELRAGAHVTRLHWSPTESRVSSVEYFDRRRRQLVTAPTRATFLAAGTVDTTMVLLNSVSADNPDGIGNSAGVLGRYLHDHPREWWTARVRRPMRALSHPLYLARRTHDESSPLMGTSHTIGLASSFERWRTFVRARTDSLGVQVFGTMVPQPDVGIRISTTSSDEILGARPDIRLSYDTQAVENIETSRRRLEEVLAAGGLGAEVSGPFHELVPGSSVHLAGTARMHHDPRFGVIDAWNRVHDAPDVVVGDMSAFTTGPEKNPTLTAMAISIRAADRLADDLGAGTT